MNEKALKPQFYKALNYNQQRDIIPKRRREWAGERISQLEKVKLYEHPEDYKDMMFSFAVPESNLIYPTFRAETGQWRHPSFDVLIPSATPAEVTTTTELETGQLLILNFNGEDGAIGTWIEEAQGLEDEFVKIGEGDPNYTKFVLDTDIKKFGVSSIMAVGAATGGNFTSQYRLPNAINGDFTVHGWFRVDGLAAWEANGGSNQTPFNFIYVGNAALADPIVRVYLTRSTVDPPNRLRHYFVDRLGNEIDSGYITTHDVQEGIWHHFAVVGYGRDVMYFMDGGKLGTYPAGISAPFAGLKWFTIEADYRLTIGTNLHWDAHEMVDYAKWKTNFTPPKYPPVKGIVTV